MEVHARAPEPLKNTKPMDKTWKMWKQEFLIFLKVAGHDKSENKGTLLIHYMGKLAHEVMQDIEFENKAEEEDFDVLIKKFDDYFDPPKSETEERYKFYTRHKKNNETIEAYIVDLKEKAKTCNFGDLTESLIRDMIILDIKDKHLRQIMFDARDLEMNKLIMLYKQFELNTEKMKEVSKKTNEENTGAKSKDNGGAASNASRICWKCGMNHPLKNCPAFKIECEKCKEKGHFTQRCNKSHSSNTKNNNANQNANKNKNYSKSPFHQSEKAKNENKKN